MNVYTQKRNRNTVIHFFRHNSRLLFFDQKQIDMTTLHETMKAMNERSTGKNVRSRVIQKGAVDIRIFCNRILNIITYLLI